MNALKLSDCIEFNENGSILLIGLTLEVPNSIQSTDTAVSYIQQNYFDNLGSNGFFRLLPQTHKYLASTEYLKLTTFVDPAIINASLQISSEYSSIDILLAQYGFLDEVELELKHVSAELNAFVAADFANSWKQFNLKSDTVSSNISKY